MVAGDFNLIYRDEDKNNANYNRAMMGRFRRFINDLALKEIPLHGRKYTWSNQQNSPTLVKLDRVLCSVNWEEKFPNCLLQMILIISLFCWASKIIDQDDPDFTLSPFGQNSMGSRRLSLQRGLQPLLAHALL